MLRQIGRDDAVGGGVVVDAGREQQRLAVAAHRFEDRALLRFHAALVPLVVRQVEPVEDDAAIPDGRTHLIDAAGVALDEAHAGDRHRKAAAKAGNVPAGGDERLCNGVGDVAVDAEDGDLFGGHLLSPSLDDPKL
jgi:hypothetical protein